MESATVDATERRLENRDARSLPMPAGCAIAVGLPFAALGVVMALGLLSILRSGRGPVQIRVVLPLSFIVLIFGLGFVVYGARTYLRKARAHHRARLQPGEPWAVDWGWDPEGTTQERTSGGSQLLVLVLLGLACAVFSYPVFVLLPHSDGSTPLPVKVFVYGIVGVWDLLFLKFLFDGLRAAARRLGTGRARLHYDHFPFLLGRPLEARVVAKALGGRQSVAVSLRCLEERVMSRTKASGRRMSTVEVYQLYECRQNLAGCVGEDLGLVVSLPLPEGDYASRLRHEVPRYWELELQAAGIDPIRFLVPVYGRLTA
jgi:hypothetical protein